MPSKSYLTFLQMRIDVSRLIETHYHFSNDSRGRKHLGHLTRSGVVMLCAAWERYNEDLLLEGIRFLCESISDANLLNKKIKQTISKKVKESKNEIEPIELASDGWKTIWIKYAKHETELLHTPKKEKLENLFKNYLGIDNYSRLWNEKELNLVDDFVKVRGEIAHNGNQAKYVRINSLRNYADSLLQIVINIDSTIADELNIIAGNVGLPWTKYYSKDIKNYSIGLTNL